MGFWEEAEAWFNDNIVDPIVELYEYAVDNVDNFVENAILPQFEDNFISQWLYEDNWTKGKYAIYLGSQGVPLVGTYFNWLLGMRQSQEYLDQNQLDWSDIHNPRKLPGGNEGNSASLFRGGINFISDNVKRLYS